MSKLTQVIQSLNLCKLMIVPVCQRTPCNTISTAIPWLSVTTQLSSDLSRDSWPENLAQALNNLKAFATDKNFSICDVPRDGNSLFSALLYQLESCGLLSSTVEHLRQLVA